MKNSRIILALILVATMLFTLAGCGAKDSDQFLGSWEATIDLADSIQEGLTAANAEMAEYIKISKLEVRAIFTFKEDGTFEITADKDFLTQSMESAKADMKAGLEKMYQDMLKENNYDMTVDEFLDSQGITLDALCDEALGEETVNSVIADMATQGNFVAKDGKLFMSAGLNYAIDEKSYEVYEISDNQLKLTSHVSEDSDGEDEGVFDDNMYPVVFTRVETAA